MPQWKEVSAPARKADYRYKFLRLLDTPPRQRIGYGPDGSYWKRELPIRAGDVVQISMRRSAAETGHLCSVNDVSAWGERVLEVEWPCLHCLHPHHVMIPESWITEGKAVFVEKVSEEKHA